MKMKEITSGVLLIVFLMFSIGNLHATVPNAIAYQGRIREYNQLFTGSKDIEIAIFSQETGGSAVYTQTFMNTAVVNGIFNVMINPNVDWRNGNHWLQTTISGKILHPRTLITSDFYALHAKTAEGISVFDGGEIHLTIGSSNVVKVTNKQLKIDGRVKDKTGFIMPVGTVISYAGDTIPDGWLECDGRLLTAGQEDNTYRDLYDAIGTSWGGSGESFNLPDLRGLFLRGVAGTSQSDPDKTTRTAQTVGGNNGNSVGSVQEDITKQEAVMHLAPNLTMQRFSIATSNYSAGNYDDSVGYLLSGMSNKRAEQPNSMGMMGVVVSGKGSETRPKNAYVKYIIKY